MNKIRCPHGISPKGNCDVCLKKYREKYCQSLEYKERRRESRKKYYQSHRQQILERQKRYHQSPKYKESIKKYQQSPKYKEYHKKYMRLYNSKIFNPSPAKPESPSKPDTDTTSVNAKTPLFEASQESASPDGKSSTESTQQTETGGGFTIIHMGKIGDEDTKCDSCGTSITKDELEVRGSQKLCTDCAVVYDIDKIKGEE